LRTYAYLPKKDWKLPPLEQGKREKRTDIRGERSTKKGKDRRKKSRGRGSYRSRNEREMTRSRENAFVQTRVHKREGKCRRLSKEGKTAAGRIEREFGQKRRKE